MKIKQYKAIFFDWDGTAVISREAPADDVIKPMKALLQKGIALIIISGTTYEKICSGQLESYFTKDELENLFLGLGRGAFNYRFDKSSKPYVWKNRIPSQENLLLIHQICFEVHQRLLSDYNLNTDIVFSRPNYCKIDIMVENSRGEQLFLQDGEIDALKRVLNEHGIEDGLHTLLEISDEIAKKHDMHISATCDAKYLEIGPTNKSDNTNDILDLLTEERGIKAEDCCFWGEESRYGYLSAATNESLLIYDYEGFSLVFIWKVVDDDRSALTGFSYVPATGMNDFSETMKELSEDFEIEE